MEADTLSDDGDAVAAGLEVLRRHQALLDDFRDQGLHVGSRKGSLVRCVTYSETWPCSESVSSDPGS